MDEETVKVLLQFFITSQSIFWLVLWGLSRLWKLNNLPKIKRKKSARKVKRKDGKERGGIVEEKLKETVLHEEELKENVLLDLNFFIFIFFMAYQPSNFLLHLLSIYNFV